QDVVMDVRCELPAPGRPSPGLTRKVIDALRTLQDGIEVGLRQIDLGDLEPGAIPECGQVRLLALPLVVPREAVDGAHLVALVQEQLAQVGAHEAGRAGHDGPHGAAPVVARSSGRPHRARAAMTPNNAQICRKWSTSWDRAESATATSAPTSGPVERRTAANA